MAFEIIEGLALKTWTEMNKEEKELYYSDMWEDTKPEESSPESIIKYMHLEKEELFSTVQFLERIREELTSSAEKTGYVNEWPHLDVNFLLTLLQLRARSERGEL